MAFYQELLGVPIQARRGRTTLLRLGDGPQLVAIEPVEAGEAPSISRIGIAVANFDVDRVVQQLLDSGLTSVGDGVPGKTRVCSMKSCDTGCIIAHQRWLAPTSAESVKSPYFQRSRAPTSARLISPE